MYDTHNPGFCYHCTGVIKKSSQIIEQEQVPKDSYEFVRSIVFTKGEVDPDKVLCLHLLTAHSTKWKNNDDSIVRPITSLLEKGITSYKINAKHSFDSLYELFLKLRTNISPVRGTTSYPAT